MSSELDKNLACANAIEMTREKTEAGFVPNYAAASNYKSRDRSQPPVGALAVWEIYRKYNEKWLLEEVFDDLLGWNRWYCEHRMIANGALCWGSEPYIPVNGMGGERGSVNDLQGAKFESGLDNSPMYDDTEFDEETHLMKLADVGLTGLYIMDCDILAKIAKELGHDAEYKELTERSAKANKGLQTLWDDKTGIFQNKYTDSSDFYRRISPTNFYSLQSGEISEYQKQRVIDEHFYNENEFFGEWMMPSISKNDEAYPSQNYWRGLIWGPMNFLVYMALRRQGLEKPCHDLAERSANLFLKVWRKYGHICENYNAVAGDACGDRFYHWGGLLAYIAIIDGVNGDKL